MNLTVNLGKDSYVIHIQADLLSQIKELVSSVYSKGRIAIISDDNVFPLYGNELIKQLEDAYEVGSIVIPHGEASKSFTTLPDIYSQLLNMHITRTDLIIALGGGVIGDLAGFVASTYLRGIKFIQIPTSLLAQVDSSVGGKVAVDLPEGKNLVGAFKHPLMVIIDSNTLKTLPHHFIADGMGEVIKYGCIKDAELFERLAQYESYDALFSEIDDIITRCVDIKRDVVEKDLYDFGDRLCLNFGHTIGHAIEQYYHFDRFSHGEAVGVGMVAITTISENRGYTLPGTSQRIIELLKKYDLPVSADVKTTDLLAAVSHDKKNINNTFSYVMLKQIGESYIHKDTHELILEVEKV